MWWTHDPQMGGLFLGHYFVYSHPPNIKHPLRSHRLVGKFHTSMGPFGSFFFKRGWDDENRLIHAMKCGDPNIAPVAQGNWHLIWYIMYIDIYKIYAYMIIHIYICMYMCINVYVMLILMLMLMYLYVYVCVCVSMFYSDVGPYDYCCWEVVLICSILLNMCPQLTWSLEAVRDLGMPFSFTTQI